MKYVLIIGVLATIIRGYAATNFAEEYPEFHDPDVNAKERVPKFTRAEAENATRFWLYTRENPTVADSQELKTNKTDLLDKSHFNISWPVRFLIHGLTNHKESEFNTNITNAYLEKGDFNVIVVDWGDLSARWYSLLGYFTVARSIHHVGELLADFAKFLNREKKVPFENMYLIGHSLGAHIAGYAGSKVKPHQFRTIFALDPAGPDFRKRSEERRLDPNDAYYVESIQTNSMDLISYGFKESLGHATFYPNYGKTQPGCEIFDEVRACSHTRAYEYFAESITTAKPFYGQECLNFKEIEKEHCTSPNKFVIMGGEPAQKKHFGLFYVRTNPSKPYRTEPSVPSEDVALRFNSDSKILKANTLGQLTAADINPTYPTRIIIGSAIDQAVQRCEKIRDAYLERGGLNVILVDYQKIADAGAYQIEVSPEDIAQIVGNLLEKLHNDFHISYDNIYMIGVEAGAEIANLAAKKIAPNKINTLFALDYKDVLDKNAFNYIEAMHLNSPQTNGDVNVLVEFLDKTHRKCSFAEDACIRSREELFAETIRYPGKLLAIKCKSQSFFGMENCDKNDKVAFGGEPSNANGTRFPRLLYQEHRDYELNYFSDGSIF